jgi:hypothetical protein
LLQKRCHKTIRNSPIGAVFRLKWAALVLFIQHFCEGQIAKKGCLQQLWKAKRACWRVCGLKRKGSSGDGLGSHTVTRAVGWALAGLTTGFEKGPGVTLPLKTPEDPTTA